jgi:hypothetical protein
MFRSEGKIQYKDKKEIRNLIWNIKFKKNILHSHNSTKSNRNIVEIGKINTSDTNVHDL